MQVFWTAVALMLVFSLTVPRRWLHLIGFVGCALLAVHALQLGDAAFFFLQIGCLIAHVVGWAAFCIRTVPQRCGPAPGGLSSPLASDRPRGARAPADLLTGDPTDGQTQTQTKPTP